MSVQPIPCAEMRRDRGDGLVSSARDMERRFAATDEAFLQRIDLARQQHVAVEIEGLGMIDH